MTDLDFNTLKKYGRIAGILYLVIIVCGIFSEGVVRSGLIVPGDAAATAASISESQLLFRFGFAGDLIMVLADIAIALVFYLMLKQVNKPLSQLAALFRFAQAIIIGVNLLNHFAVILVMNNSGITQSFNGEQVNSIISFFLEAHTYGYLLSGVFFGFSCLVLGYLFKKSGFIPVLFGWMIGIAGAFYITDSFTQFLFPEAAFVTEILVIAGALIAEVSFAFWLLVKGAKPMNSTQSP